jgi:uncharacterized protein (TIGR03083 family)
MKMATEDLMELIAGQRGELAAILGDLPEESWDAPTLCEGWRVREVVAHMTMPFRYEPEQFMAELGKSDGDFTALSDRLAAQDAAALSPAELTESIRTNVRTRWEPPGGGLTAALSHDMIHGLDFAVPLGLGFNVPEERLRAILPVSADEPSVKFFGVDLDGIELRASDMDWTLGSGTTLTGTGQDLLLVLCGRKLPAGRLHGEPSGRFTATGVGG